MTAFEFIHFLGVIPLSVEKTPSKETPASVPTNAEIRRWCDQGAVVINGKRPKAKEEISFPVTQLVFFPKGIRKTTVL